MTKLLTEEELRNTLLLDVLHATNVTGRHIEDLVNLIQSQKIAHGEMVIGGKIKHTGDQYCEVSCECGADRANELIAEQRERNNTEAGDAD